MALLLPFLHEFLIFAELATVRGSLLLLNRSNQVLFLLVLGKSIVEIRFLSHLELDEMAILHSLLVRAHIFALYSTRLDATSEVHCLFHVLGKLLLHGAHLQTSHCLGFKGIRRRALTLLNRKFELVKKAQSRTSFLLHNVVSEFAIEANLEVTECVFNQVEVVDLGFLIRPIHKMI